MYIVQELQLQILIHKIMKQKVSIWSISCTLIQSVYLIHHFQVVTTMKRHIVIEHQNQVILESPNIFQKLLSTLSKILLLLFLVKMQFIKLNNRDFDKILQNTISNNASQKMYEDQIENISKNDFWFTKKTKLNLTLSTLQQQNAPSM